MPLRTPASRSSERRPDSTFSDVLANVKLFVLVVAGALILDGVLHVTGRPDIGRYTGYLGTALICVSFVYSARKRKMIRRGSVSAHLLFHEAMALIGAMLVLVHGGIHFNALLPWLAAAAMLVAVASGLTGKYLLKKSKSRISETRKKLLGQGLSPEEVDNHLHFDSLLVDLMKRWRVVHMPITSLFAFLALLHVVSAVMFWNW